MAAGQRKPAPVPEECNACSGSTNIACGEALNVTDIPGYTPIDTNSTEYLIAHSLDIFVFFDYLQPIKHYRPH